MHVWAALLVGLLALSAAEPSARLLFTVPAGGLLGAPSRDGRFLTVVDPSTRALALRTLPGGETRLLFANPAAPAEFAYFSAPSPDGGRIAYAWFNSDKFYDLRVVAETAGAPRVLFRNPEVAFLQPTCWTPDGQWILTLFFRRDNISQIALIHAFTAEVRILRSLNWVYPKKMDISPDGRWIVYDSFPGDRAGPRDLYLLALDGSREARLTDHPADDLFPVWAPAGHEVVFASDRLGTLDAWALPIRDARPAGEPRLIRRGLGRFLPLGVTRSGGLYYGVRAAEPEVAFYTRPSATPGRLAFLLRRGAENFGLQARVLVLRSPSGEGRELDVKLAHMEKLRWAPGGGQLLVSGSDGKGRAGLFRVDLSTAAHRPLVLDDNADYRGVEGAWLDEHRIAYLQNEQVRERDLTTGADKPLYAGPARALAAGPAGLAIAAPTEVFILGAKARWPVRGIEEVHWFGSDLLVTRGRSAALLTPNGLKQLDLPGYTGGPVTVSPDSNTIAYPTGAPQEEIWVMEGLWPK